VRLGETSSSLLTTKAARSKKSISLRFMPAQALADVIGFAGYTV